MTTTGASTEYFGEPIYAYTVADALADGSMVDAGGLADEAGYHIPVVLTRAAWAHAVEWTRPGGWQDETGRLWDVLTCARAAAKAAAREPGQRFTFRLYRVANITPGGRPSCSDTARPVWLDVLAQGFDMSGCPCLTVLMLRED